MTTDRLPRVAVIGLGAMGSRLATNLLRAGHPVTVTNRTLEAAAPLVEAGAVLAHTPGEAAAAADVVLVCVRDDDASRQVWTDPLDGVLPGAAPGSLGIEVSTLSPGWVRALAAVTAEAEMRFCEAPMIGSRPQAEAGELVHLVAAPDDVREQAAAVLSVSAARLHPCDGIGSAAVLKLAVNTLLATQVATLADLLETVRAAGQDREAALGLLRGLPVLSPAAARAGTAMLAGAGTTNFPVALVRKDLGYWLRLAPSDARAGMAAAALNRFDEAAAGGLDEQDLTAIGR